MADSGRKRKRWMFSPVLIVSVVLHLFFAGGAAVYVVSHYSAQRKLTFQAGQKSPNPSEQTLQHRVQMEQRTKAQSLSATVPKRVLTTGLAKVALPPMPEMPKTKDAPAMTAAAGGGNFGGPARAPSTASIGGTGSGPAINFFGIRDTSSSVVIMIDVSDSMLPAPVTRRKANCSNSAVSKVFKQCAMKR